MTTLVVAAHPDDEVLGCGGTIARLAQEGQEVHIAILGEGMTSRYGQREYADSALLTELQSASAEAARLLGARSLYTEALPDNRFDTVPLLDVVKIVEGLIERLRPEVVYTHHAGDLNIDHLIIHRAVLTATRPMRDCPVKEILAFEVPSSTGWAFGVQGLAFMPNVFVDIAGYVEAKIAAMQLYSTESRPYPHPRSPEALTALAQYRGSTVGLEAAEAYQLVRKIRP